MKLKYLFLTTIASILGLFSIEQFIPARVVLAEPKPCSTYQIEGTMDPSDDSLPDTSTSSVTNSAPATFAQSHVRQAEVYLHFGEMPLGQHLVFATFTGRLNETLGEPVLLTTDDNGRATIEVPQEAVTVAFMSESPDAEMCSASSGSMNEPSVVAVTIPVQPTFDGPFGDGPIGDSTGITYDDIFNPIPGLQGGVKLETADLSQTSAAGGSTGELAHTGPISPGILLLTVVVLSVGLGLGLGRGRRGA